MEKEEKDNKKTETDKREEFTKKLDELRKEYGFDLMPVMDFYEYKVLPEELQLALVILNKHKVRYIFNLVEIKDNDK